MKKILMACCMLVVSISAFANDCETEHFETAAQERNCEFERSNLKVSLAFSAIVTASNNDNDAINLLNDAQLSWKKFRDSSCAYMELIAPAGLASGDVLLSCQLYFNNARIKELNALKDD